MTLKKVIGKRFDAIFGSVYFDSITNIGDDFDKDNVLDLCIVFEDMSITLRGNISGDALVISYDDVLENVDMEEHGYIKALELIDFFELREYLGFQFESLYRLVSRSKTCVCS